MDNQKLCEGLRNGDKTVLDEVYYLYHKKIFAFALSYLKNQEDAYDIVQEVFINIWNHRGDLKSDARIEPLIFTATKNAVISLFRKKSTEKKYLEYLGNATTSNNLGAEELSDFGFLEEEYHSLIDQLPEKRRKVFMLSRQKGLTNKEIAKQLGVSEKTVENQLTKALAFLREKFGSGGFLGLLFFHLFIS
ncbi:RNA polymerase sigma-70 factor [Marinilabilia salmonicolor]|nr:RNA polymerase sigma-70 factor [Marinilabilia salmonicolor]